MVHDKANHDRTGLDEWRAASGIFRSRRAYFDSTARHDRVIARIRRRILMRQLEELCRLETRW